VRESLKALLAIGWTVEHSDVEVPSNNRNSTRRTSKTSPVSITYYVYYNMCFPTSPVSVLVTDVCYSLTDVFLTCNMYVVWNM
jgi:hypothetical protein